jgi:hypothetical protein
MDARDNGESNPFENPLCCLAWIADAIDAARRHNEQRQGRDPADGSSEQAAMPNPEAFE